MSSNLFRSRGIFAVIAFHITILETILSYKILIDMVLGIIWGTNTKGLHNRVSDNILLIKEAGIT